MKFTNKKFAKENLNPVQKMSLDLYLGRTDQYSISESEDLLKESIIDACGGAWTKNKFIDHRGAVYQILEDSLSIATGYLLYDNFEDMFDTHDLALGDTIDFYVEDTSLFKVSAVSAGNRDIRRQKLYGRKIPITTEKIAVKIYEDLDRFISGRIDWKKMIDRVAESFAHEIGIRAYNAVYGSYDLLGAKYKVTATGTPEAIEDALSDAIAHVESSTGKTARVIGTKKALGKIKIAQVSDEMINTKNQLGHYGTFKGTNMSVLPQGHKAGTTDFAIDDNFLIVIPDGEKIGKLLFEGEYSVEETPQGDSRNDEVIEFFMGRKIGIAVIVANQYAIVKLS